ncbi:MAG: hypothetical protein ACRDNS_08535 [Trebonia sp.]
MALQILQFTVTIPAGTPAGAPVTTDLELDNWEIESIEAMVPAGPNGLMGFFIANNGVPWVPRSAGEYLVWDNQSQTWFVTGQPNASGWQVTGYNTGTYDHAVTLRVGVNMPADVTVGLPPPAPVFVPAPVEDPNVVVW